MTASHTEAVVMEHALYAIVVVPVKATAVRASSAATKSVSRKKIVLQNPACLITIALRAKAVVLIKNVPNIVRKDRVSEIMNARQVNTAVVWKENVPALVWENLALKAVSVEKTNIAVVPISSTARQVAVENLVPEIATVRPKDCVVVVMRNVQFVAAQKKDIVG
jgi:hypothetical protein